MSCLFLILNTVGNIGFVVSIGFMFLLCTRTIRENYEARSILGTVLFSERLVHIAPLYDKANPEFVEAIMKQHEEVKRAAEEIRSKRYSIFIGLKFDKFPGVYQLKFPREVDGKLELR